MTTENARLRNNHVLAFRHRCCDRALDDEAVARADFAVKGHPRPDYHGSAINLITPCSSLLCHRSLLESPVSRGRPNDFTERRSVQFIWQPRDFQRPGEI